MTQAYPLKWPEGWPRARSRKTARFGKTENNGSYNAKKDLTMEDAVKRVRYELERLGVKNIADDVVISTNLRLNLSGFPRGDQGEPGDPGVAVYWQKPGAPMKVMAVDAYHRVRDNVAAIAATLEAMRAIERHGGATVLERAFTGFTALAAPGSKPWWEILNLTHDATKAQIELAYRTLARQRHPDYGGSDSMMAELNRARDEALKARAA